MAGSSRTGAGQRPTRRGSSSGGRPVRGSGSRGGTARGGATRSGTRTSAARSGSATRAGSSRQRTQTSSRRLQTPSPSRAAEAVKGNSRLRVPAIIASVVAGIAVVGLVTLLILSHLPVFVITGIDAPSTQHMSSEEIIKLAAVEEGTTLLSVDVDQLQDQIRRNPWADHITVHRQFPSTLRVEVAERAVGSVVLMNPGNLAWYMDSSGVWIEPTKVTVPDGGSSVDVALGIARDAGAVLITDVPTSVSPVAGSQVTDDGINAALTYLTSFTSELRDQVVRMCAANTASISCTLASGVEVSLGSPSNIETKESVVKQILSEHPNQVTFINVRVPSSPSYRVIGSSDVQQGSGVTV